MANVLPISLRMNKILEATLLTNLENTKYVLRRTDATTNLLRTIEFKAVRDNWNLKVPHDKERKLEEFNTQMIYQMLKKQKKSISNLLEN